MTKAKLFVFLVAGLVMAAHSACGGPRAATTTSIEGTSGFVLDRTQEPPLRRLDGDEKVYALERRE